MSSGGSSFRARFALFALPAGYIGFLLAASVPASPLRPPIPTTVGIPRWFEAGSRWIGLHRLTWTRVTVLAIVLLVALVGAFAYVCRETWNGRVGLRSVIAVSVVSLSVAAAGPLVLSRDVYSYASYGRMYALYDTNPYVAAPMRFPRDPFTRFVSSEWRQTRSVYGPAFTLASAGIAGAARNSTAAAVWGFKVMAAVAVAAAMYLVAGAARAARRGREAFAAAVVGLNPVIVIHVVGAGHNDALVAALLASALLIAMRAAPSSTPKQEERPVQGQTGRAIHGSFISVTALITLAALVKVIAAIPLLLWLGHVIRSSPPGRRVRVAGVHLAVAAAVTVVVTAPLFAGWETVRALGNVASREGWASGARLVARGLRAVTGAEPSSPPGLALTAGVYLGFFVVFLNLTWRLFRASSGEPGAPWGGGLLLFALAAPYLLPWYAAWFVAFVPFMMNFGLGSVALVVAGLLSLTGVPAEPGLEPGLWRTMLLVVHYAVAPLILVLLFFAALRVRRLAPLSQT